MTKYLQWIIAVVMFVAVPVTAEELSEFHQDFADTIGTAHGNEAYRSHAALQTDITVTFGDKVMLKGVMTFDTPVGKSRIETEYGTVMVFDGETAWITPADVPVPPGMSRFHLRTWPYFIAAPFKLADPGTQIDDAGDKPLDANRILPVGKLTFGAGIGDTPDDWYIVYRDRDTHHLAAMAYIVTYGKTTGEAEKEPHVAIYEAYKAVNGVFLPTNMSLWNWAPDTGRVGEQIGLVELSNYRFVETDETTFAKPEDARVDAPPASGNEG